MIDLLSIICFSIVAVTLAVPLVLLWRMCFPAGGMRRIKRMWPILVVAVAGAFLLFRPHQHVYQGLDSSAFRHMARAFAADRPLHSVDTALAALPQEAREYVMMWPHSPERRTRERSFEVDSLQACNTQPFFYPLLPLCMNGLDLLLPGQAMDYFVPLCGYALLLALAIVLTAAMGGWAVLCLSGLWLGSPLPVWLFRGCNLEAVSAALMGLAVLVWMLRCNRSDFMRAIALKGSQQRTVDSENSRLDVLYTIWCGFALGLAVSFHPVMILAALPLMVFVALDKFGSIRLRLLTVISFAAGISPLLLMTHYVTAPYGRLSWGNLISGMRVSAAIRSVVFIGAVLTGSLILISVVWLAWRKLRERSAAFAGSRLGGGLLLFCCVMPVVLAVSLWDNAPQVLQGLREGMDALQLPFGLLLLALSLALMFSRQAVKPKLLLLVIGILLPAFLYLKGAERMGLWSMRRLLVPFVLWLCAVAGWLASARPWRIVPRPVWNIALSLLATMVLVFGLINPIRWPAPYKIRYEKGADSFVQSLADELKDATVFFDYHPHSVPLAVLPEMRVYGLSESGAPGLPAIARWIRRQAQAGETFWVTAYSNPGIEDGVRLESLGRRSVKLTRARAKTALPAVKEKAGVDLELLRVIPLQAGETASLDKVFEMGRRPGIERPQLAVRGEWGRSDISLTGPDGVRLPAQWTRRTSAVIGPVPPPGGSVKVLIEAAASRSDEQDHQVLRIVPPWGGAGQEVYIGNEYTIAEAVLVRPDGDAVDDWPTGEYLLEPLQPYNPGAVGISGFNHDLGVLLHRIRIGL